MVSCLVILGPSVASAELLRVAFKVEGMSCAYCNTTMSAALQKMDGVAKVQLAAETGQVVVELKPGNKITLEQLRRVVRSNGYPTKEAEVTAHGRVVHASGTATFDLMNGSTLVLTDASQNASEGVVEMKGIATANEKNEERLRVLSLVKK